MSIARRYTDSGPWATPLKGTLARFAPLSRRWIGGLPKAVSLYLALALMVTLGPVSAVTWYGTILDKRDSAIAHSWLMVSGQGGGDSWAPMTIALRYVESGAERPLYSEMLQVRKFKYQYPPSALFALMGLRLGGEEAIAISHVPAKIWPATPDVAGWIFYAAMVAAVISIFELELAEAKETEGEPRWLRIVLVSVLSLTFYLALKAFTLGQIQVWINAGFAIALLLWLRGRKKLSGIAIGLMCLIKPHYGLFLVWAAVRREWSFVAAAAVVFAIGTAFAVARFGWTNHFDYLAALSIIGAHGEAYFPNQSVNGLLNRWMGLAQPDLFNNQLFLFDRFPPYDNVVFWGTTLTSTLLLGGAILVGRHARDTDRSWDFCRMALSITMASPIAWEHHYAILLPIFAILLVASLHRTGWLLWLGAAYVLTFNLAPLTNQIHDTALNPLQSYVLVAALIVLTMLYMGPPVRRRRLPLAPPVASPSRG